MNGVDSWAAAPSWTAEEEEEKEKGEEELSRGGAQVRSPAPRLRQEAPSPRGPRAGSLYTCKLGQTLIKMTKLKLILIICARFNTWPLHLAPKRPR
ncbi:hypothetical protein E2C01_053183 [Portunus trituberculatus]|uniref:Uncharacterized protein n=1 Tax=Portunus trituberculatus TaxID=210409 RepID=A0A5B7GPM7_PORTR|nr:hypothetical protein [Portunus trituberculatus]